LSVTTAPQRADDETIKANGRETAAPPAGIDPYDCGGPGLRISADGNNVAVRFAAVMLTVASPPIVAPMKPLPRPLELSITAERLPPVEMLFAVKLIAASPPIEAPP